MSERKVYTFKKRYKLQESNRLILQEHQHAIGAF